MVMFTLVLVWLNSVVVWVVVKVHPRVNVVYLSGCIGGLLGTP